MYMDLIQHMAIKYLVSAKERHSISISMEDIYIYVRVCVHAFCLIFSQRASQQKDLV